jgi:hypothetical protein
VGYLNGMRRETRLFKSHGASDDSLRFKCGECKKVARMSEKSTQIEGNSLASEQRLKQIPDFGDNFGWSRARVRTDPTNKR